MYGALLKGVWHIYSCIKAYGAYTLKRPGENPAIHNCIIYTDFPPEQSSRACSSIDQRDFEVLLHFLCHIKRNSW